MTKQEIFSEVYANFPKFMHLIIGKIFTISAFTDTQKITFLNEIVTARATYNRDGTAFFDSFSAAKQDLLLSIVDRILESEETRLQASTDAVTAKRTILAG